jgi:small subunit ribosomal protein S21
LGLHRLHQGEGTSEEARGPGFAAGPFRLPPVPSTGAIVIEVRIEESDRLENALKVFKRKVQKAGLLKELRQRRHYLKPSAARQLKSAAARRRKKRDR